MRVLFLFRSALPFAVWCLTLESVFAETKVDISGDINTGIDYSHRFKRSEFYFGGKIKLESERTAGFKGVMEVEGDSDGREVFLSETYLDYKLLKDHHFEVGNRHRFLGREYILAKKERKTIRRTLLYSHLDELGYGGEQYQGNYRYKGDDRQWGVAIGGTEAEGYNASSWYATTFAGLWGAQASGIIKEDKIGEKKNYAKAAVISFSYEDGADLAELEVAYGDDPVETEYEDQLGNKTKVFWWATKGLVSRRFALTPESALEPALAVTYLRPDNRYTPYERSQILLALHWHLPKFLVAFNGDLQTNNTPAATANRSYSNSSFLFELRKYL